MKQFKNQILLNKKISIWGIGYLGYTTALQLTKYGFNINLFQFNINDLENKLKTKQYPRDEQKNTWSINGNITNLNLKKVSIKKNPDDMFDTNIHIISIPINDDIEDKNSLLKIFTKNFTKNNNSLILFESAGKPNSIEKNFIQGLIENKANYSFASAFRSDWNIEDFLANKQKRFIAGYDKSAYKKAKILFNLLDIDFVKLSSIQECEVYINAKNSLEYTISAFLNQLSLAYENIDINKLTPSLLKNLNMSDIKTGFMSNHIKNIESIEHLIEGSNDEHICSVAKEAKSNLSLILFYAEIFKKNNIKSVAILGISSQNTLKDIRFSPAIIMAEHLHALNIKVYINDPNFTEKEIKSILSFAGCIELSDTFEQDSIMIMKDYYEYKCINQNDINQNGFKNAKIIIDNIGIFQKFTFSDETIYHQIGDNNLMKLNK